MSKHYKLKEFAELLNVSVITLQRWDNDDKLKVFRTPTNRRYYTYEQYLEYKGIHKKDDDRKIVIYTRVSTSNQKDDLKNQVDFLRQYANAKGIIIDEVIEDYGSGFNNESLLQQEELVQDIISILHIFSSRIYGLRKYKKKIRKDKEVEKSL